MVANINETIGLPNYEVVVVNSGGTELSSIRGLSKVSIYETEREGAPQARNFGASKANGDSLVFADAHAEFQKGWGQRMLDSLAKVNGLLTPCIKATGDETSRGCGYTWINSQMDIEWLPDLNPSSMRFHLPVHAAPQLKRPLFWKLEVSILGRGSGGRKTLSCLLEHGS